MPKRFFALVYLALFASSALSQTRKPLPSVPDQFSIGRRTFFDFGPPFEFYEILSVHSEGDQASIERLVLTPSGDACTQPTSFEVAATSVKESVADLLGNKNPCTIPEKDLRRELKRCKNCVQFSGADVAMQFQCGDQSRLIRMDILDRDLFDQAPKTPEHTSWTISLLGRLDQALGNTVMERPTFSIAETPAHSPRELTPKFADDLNQGFFDSLFDKAAHKPSELFREARMSHPRPNVELSNSSPFRPSAYELPKYPPLARLAHIAGQVNFTLGVTSDGKASNLKFLSGHVMLQKAVEGAVSGWSFPKEAADQEIRMTIEFKTNCAPVHP